MKNQLAFLIYVAILSGCTSTTVEDQYTGLPLTQNAMQSAKWKQLNRFPARYPMKAAMGSIEGCATIEYVITPQNEIRDINVITATNKLFASAASEVINKWKWSELPQNVTKVPVKTQTRFDFCFDQPDQSCVTVKPEYSCPSEDIVYSTGMRIKVNN